LIDARTAPLSENNIAFIVKRWRQPPCAASPPRYNIDAIAVGGRLMGELAAKIAEAANQSSYDRADLLEVAKGIITKSNTSAAAEIAWAILTVIAQPQARTTPSRRLTWRPSQIRRRG
jgi:hypothetical protein